MHTSAPPFALFASAPTISVAPAAAGREKRRRPPGQALWGGHGTWTSVLVAEALGRAEVLVTGWGCPHLGAETLAAAPRLRAVLHADGSVRHLVGEPFWERGLTLSSAVQANALPVAEYTLAMILLAGKDAFGLRERFRAEHGHPAPTEYAGVGNLGRRVGLIGASRVGRRVLELLRPLDLAVSLYDPYVEAGEAAELGAVPLDLDELLSTSDIVSVHAPDIPQTHRMLNRERLALIPDGGVLINTSRGALIDHTALTDELVSGRLSAILGVTDLEPLPSNSPLSRLPNVFLTPHIVGSLGNEPARLGGTVVTELERMATGLPPAHPVHRAELAISA
ncbi:hydroxyacid dehydrogenase [Streptomyces sp. NEAU-NA10]|uniref:hydroxyacid dehydrogenase n=1 Tax=Streptomyces sp. NEAU-NA10 TaxID=3416050 RepID=UPI003CC520F1